MHAIATHATPTILAVLLAAGCRSASSPALVPVVDLIKEAHRAEQRPSAYTVTEWTASGISHPALAGPSPGRLIWTIPMPRAARFEAQVAAAGAPVRVRVGISDARIYEGLGDETIVPGALWAPVSVDLSAYAGWKLSLFYRPDRLLWRLVLSADAVAGAPGTVAWGTPQIVASTPHALEYETRRARLTRNEVP
jgi:hypothetical protein